MKRKAVFSYLIGAAVLAASLVATPAAAAHVRVYVAVPPPPVVVETIPAPPSPRHVWIGGYHRWDGSTYVWVPGQYVVRPRAHSRWVAGHWVHHRRGWYWVAGRWRR